MNSRIEDMVVAVSFTGDTIYVTLADGRVVGNPLTWHPWLAQATEDQRRHVELYEMAAYWPDLDDGLDVAGMMKGEPPKVAASAVADHQ
jgi:hypothetical protein